MDNEDLTIETIYGTFDKDQLTELKGSIDEICQYLDKVSKAREQIKEIVNLTSENLGIPKKIINKIAKTQFKNSFETEVLEYTEFEALFQAVSKQEE